MKTSKSLASIAVMCGGLLLAPSELGAQTAANAQAQPAAPVAAVTPRSPEPPASPALREPAEPAPAGWQPDGKQAAPIIERSLVRPIRPSSLPALAPTPLRILPENTAAPDPAFTRTLVSRKRAEVALHLEQGQRLLSRRQYARSVMEHATAYVYEPDPELLFGIASLCRKADLDYEAVAAYRQLLMNAPATPHRRDVDEDLKILALKLDEVDIGAPQSIRDHLDSAKRSFQSGQFLVAAQEYSLAYTLKKLPRLLFNVAQSYRRAGRMEQAYLVYSRFLEEEPQTPLRKETQGYLSELRTLAFNKPVYKRPGFWALVGTAAAAVAAGTAGAVVATQRRDPATDGGTHVLTFSLRIQTP